MRRGPGSRSPRPAVQRFPLTRIGALGGFLLLVTAAEAADIPFDAAFRSYPTDGRPSAVALLDLTGDGRPEVVSANRTTASITTQVNSGSGTLTTSRIQGVGRTPGSLAVADFNGDQIPDLAVACRTDSTLWILAGHRDGTLTPSLAIRTDVEPWSVVAADLTGDGRPDLAVTSRTRHRIQFFANRGGGFRFDPAIHLPTGRQPTELVLADATGDGRLDLLSCDYEEDTVSLFPGGEGGIATRRIAISTVLVPIALAVVDVDHDGIRDLVLLRADSPDIHVQRGLGGGVFAPPIAETPPGITEDPVTLFHADFDLDGHDEVVVAQGITAYAGIRETGPDGFGPLRLEAVGRNCVDFAAADMNGDGLLDMVTANDAQSTVSIAFGNGDGTFGRSRTLPGGGTPGDVAIADLDRDGVLDLIATEPTANRLWIRRGLGGFAFDTPIVHDTGFEPARLLVEDQDGDQDLDLAVTARWSAVRPHRGVAALFENLGDLRFAPPDELRTAEGPGGIAAVDLNGDGAREIAVACEVSDYLCIFEALGEGRFGPRVDLRHSTGPVDVAAGDFDADGFQDIVTAHDSGRQLTFWRGQGDGRLVYRSSLPTSGRPSSLRTAHLGGRSTPSLLVTILGINEFWVVESTPQGLLYVRQGTVVGPNPVDAVAVDVNGDGYEDVVVANRTGPSLSFLFGNAGGTVGERADLGLAESPLRIGLGDLDNNRRPDLAVVTSGPIGALLFLNTLAPPTPPPASGPGDVVPRMTLRAAPNPFRASVSLEFDLDAPTGVGLGVWDVSGRRIRRIVEGAVTAGAARFAWDGRDDAGHPAPPGIYFVRLETAGGRVTRKLVRLP